MGGFFSAPSIPAPPPPPLPEPVDPDKEAREARIKALIRRRRGRAGLVATGERGLRHALAEFKLEVARGYASIGYIKDVENRLTAHLLRIEAKLDGVGA